MTSERREEKRQKASLRSVGADASEDQVNTLTCVWSNRLECFPYCGIIGIWEGGTGEGGKADTAGNWAAGSRPGEP